MASDTPVGMDHRPQAGFAVSLSGDDRVLGTLMAWTVGLGKFGSTFGWRVGRFAGRERSRRTDDNGLRHESAA